MSRDFFYENVVRPVLFSLDPEEAHNLVHSMLTLPAGIFAMAGWTYRGRDLVTNLLGTHLSNPIGLAAGFDKNGSLVQVLGQMGFGFAEIGSVCARPHGGNEKPRLFRLVDDEALINRLGLNGLGVEVVATRLSQAKLTLPIGINIAKTNDASLTGKAAVDDMMRTFVRLRDLPVAFFTINASCPNTKEGCLKETGMLSELFGQLQTENHNSTPVLVKLSPDSNDDFVSELVAIAIEHKLSGFVCGNTSTSRDDLLTSADKIQSIGNGGLSGKPLARLNINLCRKVYRQKLAEQIIIGVGGVFSGEDAATYIRCGASAVELYTALVYRGPSVVKQISEELSAILRRSGKSLPQLIGSEV